MENKYSNLTDRWIQAARLTQPMTPQTIQKATKKATKPMITLV